MLPNSYNKFYTRKKEKLSVATDFPSWVYKQKRSWEEKPGRKGEMRMFRIKEGHLKPKEALDGQVKEDISDSTSTRAQTAP